MNGKLICKRSFEKTYLFFEPKLCIYYVLIKSKIHLKRFLSSDLKKWIKLIINENDLAAKIYIN